MVNKHEKHFSTVANCEYSDDEKYEKRARRDSITSDAGQWSNRGVDGGSERDELDDINTEFDDPPIRSETVHLPPKALSKTPLCDNLLEWFDEQTHKFGFEALEDSYNLSISILPTEGDWAHMVKLSTPAKIAYLLRQFCPESSRASWFTSRERLFFAKLAPEEMIRYLYLCPVDRETILRSYFKTLGFAEGWLISEERKKALARFVFEGDHENLA